MYIRRYHHQLKPDWDSFVALSRNGTFLFYRDYMDYHADRFCDCSLLAYDDKDRIVALLPAAIDGITVISHGGLSYGGWILGQKLPDMLGMMQLWPMMMDFYRSLGAKDLIYRPVPYIYHKYPSEEDLYALYRNGASVDRVLISSVIDLRSPVACSSSVKWHFNKGRREGIMVSQSDDLESFWSILTARLDERYSAVPVHTIEEMRLLKSLFPDNIVLYVAATSTGDVLGGVLVYVCGDVVKSQYAASTSFGREHHINDVLNVELIQRFRDEGYRYFDLGTANEDGGRILNEGLIGQKISYGGRGIAYMSYRQPL
ncbi:MAG: GNAT family N-acetyltransferase [Muribaculaceae bacterium]|nr:GNAT family N-acetyltransferase [Muribaculaceae bacterium]